MNRDSAGVEDGSRVRSRTLRRCGERTLPLRRDPAALRGGFTCPITESCDSRAAHPEPAVLSAGGDAPRDAVPRQG